MDSSAAIPSRSERASRGRLLASLGSGQVGAMGWRPGARGGLSGQTLVKVKNIGGTTIRRWEACSIADDSTSTEFFEKAFACSEALRLEDCGHGNECLLGVCGTWPVTYEQVYDQAEGQEPIVFQVTNSSPVIPKPSDLGEWLVAAEGIAADTWGMAFAAGIHYAMVWDKNDLLDNGPELRFVDLPEYGAGYDNSDSSPLIKLPLQVRANGRARVLAYDRLTEISDPTASGDPPHWPMDKVRLALIQRSNHFTYPTIPCKFTNATDQDPDGTDVGRRWDYNWTAKHNSSLTQENVTTALNLTETNNTIDNIGGLTRVNLDACFGAGEWQVQNSFAGGMEAMMSFCLDGSGKVQPYYALPNQVIPGAPP